MENKFILKVVVCIITSIIFFFCCNYGKILKIHFIKTVFHKKMEHDILIDSLILYIKKETEENLI